jgi:[glutamine synthetase] adenylyltransferase / [glutamine synthetase]-adenylyl-L-tyrosine phosphorylase
MARSRPRKATAGGGKLSALLSSRPFPKPKAHVLLREHGFREPARAHTAIARLYSDKLQRRSLAKIFLHLIAACAKSADPDRALVNFGRLVSALPNPNMFYHYLQEAPDRLDLIVRVFAHSQALADTLTRNAEYLHFLIAPETLKAPRGKSWLSAELGRLLMSIRVPEQKYDVVRRFRRRETLRIGARDLIGLATVEETTLELSNLADVCLQAVFEIALETLRAQFKWPAQAEPAARRFAVIGMGKLGGQELNYSSDVDVIFVYGEEGNLTPTISHHHFFTKLAEEIIRAVSTTGEEGTIFRIDLRLRPEGATGPLVRSLESCENYYAEWGETWERMALVKARPVAGDLALGEEFLQMVQPFVYARHGGENIIQQMAVLKQRIEQEIVTDDRLTRHVKLGIGGIREIEFIVQSFQVLRGARLPMLRERSTLRALPLLVKGRMLSEEEAATLANAYRFLRNVEHRLQMEMELQTHTIPDEEQALFRLARSLGFSTVKEFLAAQHAHTSAVRAVYQDVLADAGEKGASEVQPQVALEKLPEALRRAGFADVAAAGKIIEGLQHGSGFVHVSERTRELFARLFPTLMEWAGEVADPDATLLRFEQFVNAYGSRGLLYEILVRNPKLAAMLMRLGDASKFLSDTMAHRPELFDEICEGMTLTDPKSLDRMHEELVGAVMASSSAGDGEQEMPPMNVARVWKRGEMLRIGIEDVMGLVDIEQMHQEMTHLAEACLRFALEQVRAELKLTRLPFVIVGMGKFGGSELGYGADLDVLFVGGKTAQDQARTTKLATRLIEFMSHQTAGGTLFAVDARLRPDGEKGSLANTLEAHREYYLKRAQLWERQALLKARIVAGDADLGKKFMEMVHQIVFARPLTAQQVEEIRAMRRRIETERGDQKNPAFEFKTGPGGLIDVEFLVQTLQLRHGHAHPQLRTAHTLAALNRLTALGIVDEAESSQLRAHYLFLRRIESVLRRVENTSVLHLPTDEREQARLAKRLGFATRDDFLGNYQLATKRTRELYQQYMGAVAKG